MAKRSLGEVFIRSIVRQVGRDAGKVVSNKAFGDAHSTPIRMVRSVDTSQQYAGKRRSYRHDLDRVVNGDLPSTVGSAKKRLVELENAVEDFIGDLMPIGSAYEITVLKSWMEKSVDYIDDVLKIVDKPDVKKLAEEIVESFDKIKTQTKEKVAELEVPINSELLSVRRNARILIWLGLLGLLSVLIALALLGQPEPGGNTLQTSVFVLVVCLVMTIMGAVQIGSSNSNRRRQQEFAHTVQAIKQAMDSW
jgi:CHASE3 domain sensor protein